MTAIPTQKNGPSMQEFRIERQTDIPLIFDGDLLADMSSQEDGQDRWQEIRIYRTASGKYVTEVVGMSVLATDRIFRTVKIADTANDVREALFRHRGERRYLNDLSLEALEEAAEMDPNIADLMAGERI